MAPDTMNITQLPLELLQCIIKHVEPIDLGRLSMACKTFADAINDRVLIKDMYLQLLWIAGNFELMDCVQDEPLAQNYDYEQHLHDTVRLNRAMKTDDIEKKTADIQFVTRAVQHYQDNANSNVKHSLNMKYIRELFGSHPLNNDLFLRQSQKTYQRLQKHPGTRFPALSPEDKQATAKLHVLRGITFHEAVEAFAVAASNVYDLRQYTTLNMWGPYMNDGLATVDWEKIEAVMIVLTCNLGAYQTRGGGWIRTQWNNAAWDGRARPNTFRHISIRETESPPMKSTDWDPYNVTGTWLRLFHYNFVEPHHDPDRDAPRRPLTQAAEAIRMIIVEIRAIETIEHEEIDGKDLPVVYFEGVSRSMHASWDPNANSFLKGTVRQTKEGEIRWTSYSVYGGEERWKSEGIQVGGINSTRGVVGDHDRHGPAGPTCFWKVSDDLLEQDDEHHKIVRDFFYDDSILADLGSSESGDDDDDDAHSESDESDHDLSEDANDSTENTGQTGNDENTNASTLLQLLAGNAPTTQVVLIDENGNETFAQFIAMPIAGLGQDSEESD
ncbi:F-box domain-containing protein [Rutstroemia sp. NJR-2017a WRK4]|nr:F-box domain-containing protein [Rutstroemia sp. NJR-2017a WRK4]